MDVDSSVENDITWTLALWIKFTEMSDYKNIRCFHYIQGSFSGEQQSLSQACAVAVVT